MKVLISGICGFAGSHIARFLLESREGLTIAGVDSLARAGSETNRLELRRLGASVMHGDIRIASDIEALPAADWVIDAAAQPSVLAGRDGKTSSRQLLEHNLLGTINLLEYCRAHHAGLILISTSRVYSIAALGSMPLRVEGEAFAIDEEKSRPAGSGPGGVTEEFSTEAPISLYGATKLASERLAQEYAACFGVPLWINRCGVLAGGGQFGTAEQGIFSFWIHAHRARRKLKYLGFGGRGFQVRDALHPRDLAAMVEHEMRSAAMGEMFNVSGGSANSMSLKQLTAWCNERFGEYEPAEEGSERPYDVPWIVLDAAKAQAATGWKPKIKLQEILEEIAKHAEANPDWLTRCEA
jgi:CDP-paratose 2-epimerase